MLRINKKNRFAKVLREARKLEDEASKIIYEHFTTGRIAALITVENATELAEHHESLMNMYRTVAQEEFTCDCCQSKVGREEIFLHPED